LPKKATGSSIPSLPDAIQDDAQYTAWVGEGEQYLKDADAYGAALALARSPRPEDYKEEPNVPPKAWEQRYAWPVWWRLRRWRKEQEAKALTDAKVTPKRLWQPWRWGFLDGQRNERKTALAEAEDKFLAAQRAILQLVQREHFAVGEEGVEHMYTGTRSPDAQTVGMRSDPTSLRRYGDGAAAENFFAGQINDGNIARPMTRGRTWAMDTEAVSVLPRVSADLTPELQAEWDALAGNASDPPGTAHRNFYQTHSHLRPDTDEVVRAAAVRSRDQYLRWWMFWLSPELRYSGMVRQGDNPRKLGGTAAITAGAACVVGFGVVKWALALFGVAISAPISLGTMIGLVALAIVIPRILDEMSHWLDVGYRYIPEGRWTGWLRSCCRVAGPWLNRIAGVAGSIAVGSWLWTAAHNWILTQAVGWGAFSVVSGLLSGGVLTLIALITITAVVVSFLVMRWDMEVSHGPRGEGIGAVSYVPGLLIQYPLNWIFKAVVLTLNSWLPEGIGVLGGLAIGSSLLMGGPVTWVTALIALTMTLLTTFGLIALMRPFAWVFRFLLDVPKSLDLYFVSPIAKTFAPIAVTGLHDRMEYPMSFGTAFGPGKLIWRLTLWMRRITAQEGSPVPLGTIRRLGWELRWTAVLGLNLLPHQARDFGKALAEDTLLGWMLGLKNVGEPGSPAVSLHDLNHAQKRIQERRNEEGSVKRAYQLSKGMALAEAIREMSAGDELEQFVTALTGLLQKEQVLTGAGHGAGVYAYLFTAFTARQLYMKLVGLYSPGEIEALYTYLYYEARDRVLGGRLARQLFQMNADHPQNPLHGKTFVEGNLSSPAVRRQLLSGWAADPRGVVAAAKAAQERGRVAMNGATEVVDIRHLYVRTMGGLAGGYQMDPVESNARQRKAVDLLHMMDKHRIVRLKTSILEKTDLVQAHPVGADMGRSKRKSQRRAARATRHAARAAQNQTASTETQAASTTESADSAPTDGASAADGASAGLEERSPRDWFQEDPAWVMVRTALNETAGVQAIWISEMGENDAARTFSISAADRARYGKRLEAIFQAMREGETSKTFLEDSVMLGRLYSELSKILPAADRDLSYSWGEVSVVLDGLQMDLARLNPLTFDEAAAHFKRTLRLIGPEQSYPVTVMAEEPEAVFEGMEKMGRVPREVMFMLPEGHEELFLRLGSRKDVMPFASGTLEENEPIEMHSHTGGFFSLGYDENLDVPLTVVFSPGRWIAKSPRAPQGSFLDGGTVVLLGEEGFEPADFIPGEGAERGVRELQRYARSLVDSGEAIRITAGNGAVVDSIPWATARELLDETQNFKTFLEMDWMGVAAVPAGVGLEEAASAGRPHRLAEQLSSLEARLTALPNRIHSQEAAALSQQLRDTALAPRAEVRLEDSMAAMRIRSRLQEHLLESAADKVVEAARVGGSYIPPEGPKAELLIFEENLISWAPAAAQLGVPVAVITDTLQEARGLERLFARLELRAPYRVVSLEETWTREAAMERIQAHFPEEIFSYVSINEEMRRRLAQIKQVLEQHGLFFYKDVLESAEAVKDYLRSLA